MTLQARGWRVGRAALGWIPLALALSAMSPVRSCFDTPEQAKLRELQFQQKMNWNPEMAARIQAQVEALQPYHWNYPEPPGEARRGSNDDFRFLRGLSLKP